MDFNGFRLDSMDDSCSRNYSSYLDYKELLSIRGSKIVSISYFFVLAWRSSETESPLLCQQTLCGHLAAALIAQKFMNPSRTLEEITKNMQNSERDFPPIFHSGRSRESKMLERKGNYN